MSWPKTPEQHGHAKLGDELRSMIKGMSVSVDVSTGDHDAGHRYFGTVTEVMDDLYDKHGVTLLVQDAEPNFALTPPSMLEDAARYRFLAGHCRRTSEHWGGRWSIIIDGPAPESHDSEDDFDAAVDAARAKASFEQKD